MKGDYPVIDADVLVIGGGSGGPVGYYRTCWFCLPGEVECPEQVIWVEVACLLR